VKQAPKTYVLFALLTVAYLVLQLTVTPDAARLRAYHITAPAYHILVFSLSIPYVLIWFAAFYGYAKFQGFSQLVSRTSEGKAHRSLAIGLRWLAWSLPIAAIVSAVLNAIARQATGFTSAALIIEHYVTLTLSLLAFSYLSVGTNQLMRLSRARISIGGMRALVGIFTIIGVAYCYITLHNIYTLHPSPFRMPLWLVLFTIIIPYLYAWFMGLMAAYEIFSYSKKTKGVIYRRALLLLGSGIVLIIATSIALQYLTSDISQLSGLTLSYLVFIIYLLLAVYAAGYLLIAAGSQRLKRMEEV